MPRRGQRGWFGPLTGWSPTDQFGPQGADWAGDDITCRYCPKPDTKPLYRILAAHTPVEARCVKCGRLVLGYRIVPVT